MKKITSLQHPIVKHCVKLRKDKKYRKECGTVLIEGKKLVKELSANQSLVKLLTSDPHFHVTADEVYEVSQAIIDKISDTPSSEGIIAEVSLPKDVQLLQTNRLLALDGINDPGNLGTLIRTAKAFGWDGVILLPGCCDPFNEKALRAAKGATFSLSIVSMEMREMRSEFPQHLIYAADIEGVDFSEVKRSDNIILVLGSEANGISDQVLEFASRVTIPMKGDMESLNVGVAGGLLMHHFHH